MLLLFDWFASWDIKENLSKNYKTSENKEK